MFKFILVYLFPRPTLHNVLNKYPVEATLLSINIRETDVCVNNRRAPQDICVLRSIQYLHKTHRFPGIRC